MQHNIYYQTLRSNF